MASRQFLQGALQQVADFEFFGPLAQIPQVEFAGPGFEHAQNVAPLTLGNFAAQPVPLQFGQDGVFSASKIGADGRFKLKGLTLNAGELRLLEKGAGVE